jgi:hypothetical protein
MDGRPAEPDQLLVLTRHFFHRLFRNDMIDFEDQMKEKLIVALTLLAVFFSWAAWLMMFKYHFVPDLNRSWEEKTYLFSLMMLVFAIVTLLEWDVLFPDRRDFLNLLVLPLRLRTLFAAKLASFILFIGLFSLAMTAIPAVLFAFYLAEWRANSLVFEARYVFSHLVSGFAAGATVFFGILFLQFLLMAALPERVHRRVATAVRFILAVGLAFVLLSFIAAPTILSGLFRDLEALKASGAPALRGFPPLWFVGLYETLLGTRDAFFQAAALKGVAVLVLSLLGFVGAAALSYARHVRRTLETARPRGLGGGGLHAAWAKLLAGTVLRTPEERAVHGFFAGTVRSSPRHRISIVYAGAAGAAVALTLIAAHRLEFRALTPANGFLLVVPLIPAFAVVAGVRAVVDRPAALEANWIFRLTESPRTRLYAAGLKKAIVLKFLVPWFGFVTAVHAALWDVREASLHGAFGLIVSVLALETVFFRYRKVPFACSWVPGKLKLHFTAIPGLVGLLLLMMALAAIEKGILADPRRGAVYLGLAAAAGLALERRNRRFYRTAALLFDEEPPGAMIELPSGD